MTQDNRRDEVVVRSQPFIDLPNELIDGHFSLEAVAIYAYVARHRRVSVTDIRDHFGIHEMDVHQSLQDLEMAGIVSLGFVADGRGKNYELGYYREKVWTEPENEPIPMPSQAKPQTEIMPGYVYVIRCGPYFKIGRTNKIERRMVQLGVQMPHPIEVVWTKHVSNMHGAEKYLHAMFHHKRMNGEWFDLDMNDIEAILKEYKD